MTDLDNLVKIKKLDQYGVLESIDLFAEQCRQTWTDMKKLKFPDTFKKAKNIVVCGMGGSRFTPRTIKELYADKILVPYEIIDDYSLPQYVDHDTLVVLSSYSGTTEEVVSCGKQALSRHALLTGITKGGTVKKLLDDSGNMGYYFVEKYNPCHQPRIGGGYMLFGHLGLLVKNGLLKLSEDEIDQAISFMSQSATKFKANVTTDKNHAKKLALQLKDKHPFIIASGFLRGFANGFANQINENAKMISDYRYIPELNHHLMEGLKKPDLLHKNGIFVMILSDLYEESIQKRFKITQEIVQKQGLQVLNIDLKGKSKLDQTLYAFCLSGYATYYLAMLYDRDPVKIPWVDYFKEKLAQ